ncbi:hypothetical protein LIA77_10518 [Sarocladium implicatum]|nr:hypothetical protein LIA77_10518 [Sarocladium implicatum]
MVQGDEGDERTLSAPSHIRATGYSEVSARLVISNVADDDAGLLMLESKRSSWICQQQREESGDRIRLSGRGGEGVSLTGEREGGYAPGVGKALQVNMSVHSGMKAQACIESPSLLIEHARSITPDWLATTVCVDGGSISGESLRHVASQRSLRHHREFFSTAQRRLRGERVGYRHGVGGG